MTNPLPFRNYIMYTLNCAREALDRMRRHRTGRGRSDPQNFLKIIAESLLERVPKGGTHRAEWTVMLSLKARHIENRKAATMSTTLDLIYSETKHNIYIYTDRTIALAVVAGLLKAGERAYFGMIAGHDTTFATTATNDMVNATEAAVLTYADIAGARLVTR